MAIAGLACAILAFFFSFIPCIGQFISLILATLGLIFSGVGIAKANKLGGEGRGLAIAGLVISILDFIWLLLIVLFIGALMARGH